MKNKGKKDKKGKEITFSPNVEVLEMECRDWETYLLNDVCKNPKKYRKRKQ
jgi:hypothetical protein